MGRRKSPNSGISNVFYHLLDSEIDTKNILRVKNLESALMNNKIEENSLIKIYTRFGGDLSESDRIFKVKDLIEYGTDRITKMDYIKEGKMTAEGQLYLIEYDLLKEVPDYNDLKK